MPFLPITIEEMKEYGWDQPDFIYITGDAYVDHPSFGPAIITRVLENFGYKCCIMCTYNIRNNNFSNNINDKIIHKIKKKFS